MNLDTMKYEFLIRSAFQCGRYGVAGANADVYRHLVKLNYEDTPHRRDEYLVRLGKIVGYLDVAVSVVQRKFSDVLSEEQKIELAECRTLLASPSI